MGRCSGIGRVACFALAVDMVVWGAIEKGLRQAFMIWLYSVRIAP